MTGMCAKITKHNQHALTGWVKCGWCGGGKQLANAGRYLCSTHRYAKKCSNSRGTKEQVLLVAVFEALQERIQTGRDFRPTMVRAMERETADLGKFQKREAEIQARIQRLVSAVEQGVAKEHVVARIVALQSEHADIRQKVAEERFPVLPSETAIRSALAKAIGDIELCENVKRMRLMFKCLLDKIVLTPVVDRRSGETITITLREDGWPEFWRQLTA